METRPTGTQSIERAIHLMKLLATRGKFGWGLTDLARRSGLDKATVHRILGCLEHERLVERDDREHRYFPGPMLMDLGLSVAGHQPLLEAGRTTIARLAQRTGGVSFFYLRSGREFVVAGRVESTAHRGMLNEVGFRRPLMTSAGGVAILVALPAAERDEIIEHNRRELRETQVPEPERYERLLARSLECGWGVNLGDVAAGIHSFAKPVLDRAGLPIGSISVAGEPARFPAESMRKYAELLAHEATELAMFVQSLNGAARPYAPLQLATAA